MPRTSEADPAGDAAVNLVGTLNLLARCAAAGVHRLLLASSGGTVYGLAERTPIDERHPTRPCSAHGALKLALEGYAGAFRASRGLDTVILRVANAYGTGQDPTRPQGIVAIFLDRLLRDEPIRLEGDGAAMRDFVHVEDVADAFARARCADLRDRIFNIGTGRGATVREVLARIERETGQQARIEVSPANPCDVPVNVLDCSRARDQLGWSPALDLAEGIRRTVADRIGHAPPARRDGTSRGAESPAG